MFTVDFKIYINNFYYESLYDIGYYSDRRFTMQGGSKQFFTINQIIKSGNIMLTIVEVSTGKRQVIYNELDFREFVKQNYPSFLSSLNSYFSEDKLD